MFGMGFFEIVVIAIVAIIFLGPDKLPQAIIDMVKFFKVVKKTIHDAKQTIDSELHLSTLQQEASSYHQHFTSQIDNITKDIQLQEINDIFQDYKALPQSQSQQSEPKALEPSSSSLLPSPAQNLAKTKQAKRADSPKAQNLATQKAQKTPIKSQATKSAKPKPSTRKSTKPTKSHPNLPESIISFHQKAQKVDSRIFHNTDIFTPTNTMDCHAVQAVLAMTENNAVSEKVDSKKTTQSIKKSQNKKAEIVLDSDSQAAGFLMKNRGFLKKHRRSLSGVPCFQGVGEGILLGDNEQVPAAESTIYRKRSNTHTQTKANAKK